MIEIECPTCETRFSVLRKVELGDKVECPECGELLRVVSVSPLEVEYWEEEEEEEEEEEGYTAAADTEEILELEEEFTRGVDIEDEENENFELPEKSSLVNETEEEEESEEEEEEEGEEKY